MNIKAVVSKAENHIYWKKIEWGFYDKMDDESFLKMAYKRKFGKELDLKNPVTFNEKLQWLKLHDRKPEYTTMVDKYEAKAYIAQKTPHQYLNRVQWYFGHKGIQSAPFQYLQGIFRLNEMC